MTITSSLRFLYISGDLAYCVPSQAFLWFQRRRFTSFLKFSLKKISMADAPPTRTYFSAPYLWLKVETAFM